MFNCAVCGNQAHDQFKVPDAKSNEALDISICVACGLVQQSHLPTGDELRIYYSHTYRIDYKNNYSPKSKYVLRAGIAAKKRIAILKKHIDNSKNLSLLDVGAGGGEFVYIATRHGFTARGIEPNLGYSEYAREQYGVEIQTSMLANIETNSADIITMFHVLEHMAHPKQVVSKIYDALKKDGILFIEVPNILQNDASPSNIFFKAHLLYFSKYSLVELLSTHFDALSVFDSGNLIGLFKKKSVPLEDIKIDDASYPQTLKRLSSKGWIEYIFTGGGWKKPFKRLARHLTELKMGKLSARQILDDVYEHKN